MEKGKRARDHEIAWLTIRERRIVGADGESSVEAHVDCPRRGATVAFEHCRRCAFGEIYFVDGARRTRLYCTHAPPPPSQPRACSFDANTPIRQVMGDRCSCVREDVSVETIEALFREGGASVVTVIDAEGRPVGMIAKTGELGPGRRAADVMSPLVFAVTENATIAQTVPLMALEGVHHAPVVGDGERVIGVVTSMDLLRFFTNVLVSP